MGSTRPAVTLVCIPRQAALLRLVRFPQMACLGLIGDAVKFGVQLGSWGAQPPADVEDIVEAAEGSRYDAIFTAELWRSDAFTPLAWWGRQTSRIKLGTSVVQISGRAPTSIAMHALTLDHLSKGRVLGMGVSGPQVVEGWYGQPFAKPARTREAVSIVRQVLSRESPVTNDGPHYPIPHAGPSTTGLGKPIRSIVHPLRSDLPIWLGGRGTEEYRSDRRDRRRLATHLLHAQVRRCLRGLA
jgi:F420-dependent oxidoreductase-like protein